jgi:hypothetical protein
LRENKVEKPAEVVIDTIKKEKVDEPQETPKEGGDLENGQQLS